MLARCRPTPERAAAAARLVGATGPALKPDSRIVRRVDRPNLEVVDDSKRTAARRQRRTRLLLAVAATLGFTVALALVYLHVVMAQRQFALDKLSTTVSQQQQTYEQLRYEVAQLGSPSHIITMAEGQLGLAQPESVTYLTPAVTIPGAPADSAGTYAPLSGQAPAGDADWPLVKSQLAGQP